MKANIVRFNRQDQPEFYNELRKRVNNYLKENNISRYANTNMKIKTVFMLSLYFIPLLLLITGTVSSPGVMFMLWVLMGFGMAGIGLSIMHDANHGSYSRNKKVNSVLGFLANFGGVYHVNWKIQHNVLHHSFTNVEGFDEDIQTPVMRFSPTQKRRSYYRFQVLYAPFLYGLMNINWLLTKDFLQLPRFHKKNLLASQGLNLRKAMIQVIFHKTWYLGLTLVLPMLVIDLPWWQVLLGFLLMQYICGLTLALIFQTAHVLQETSFYKIDENGSVENNWAIHQMRTTANFANRSVLFSWFIGGLNYQIEHHLFPYICHVHYKKISKIVQETAQDFNVPYHQHRTFVGALKSHFSLLHQLGTGQYDKKLAAAKVRA